MPYCPNCRYEYDADIDLCPDCGEKLTNSLEDDHETDNPDSDEKWIPLARLTSTQYAEMVVEALRAKDIPAVAYSKAGHFGQIGTMGQASYVSVGDGYLILVPAEFASVADQEAETILGEVWTKSRLEDQLDE